MEQLGPKRLPNNVPGRYFTTEECDGCAYCASVAPENFDYEKNTNTYFVSRQPTMHWPCSDVQARIQSFVEAKHVS